MHKVVSVRPGWHRGPGEDRAAQEKSKSNIIAGSWKIVAIHYGEMGKGFLNTLRNTAAKE